MLLFLGSYFSNLSYWSATQNLQRELLGASSLLAQASGKLKQIMQRLSLVNYHGFRKASSVHINIYSNLGKSLTISRVSFSQHIFIADLLVTSAILGPGSSREQNKVLLLVELVEETLDKLIHIYQSVKKI